MLARVQHHLRAAQHRLQAIFLYQYIYLLSRETGTIFALPSTVCKPNLVYQYIDLLSRETRDKCQNKQALNVVRLVPIRTGMHAARRNAQERLHLRGERDRDVARQPRAHAAVRQRLNHEEHVGRTAAAEPRHGAQQLLVHLAAAPT